LQKNLNFIKISEKICIVL